MAYIYRRGKYWWVGYCEGGKDIQKSLKVTSKRAAELLLTEYQTVEAKYHNRSKILSLKKNLMEVIEEYARGRARQKTSKWYKWCGEQFVNFCLKQGIEDISDISDKTVEDFYIERREKGRAKQKSSSTGHIKTDPGGGASMLLGIKVILNYAVRKRYISENPATHVKAHKPVKKLFRDLTFEEVKQLLKSAKKHCPGVYPIFAVAYYAGLREGELIYLKPEEINYKGKYIDVKSKPENLVKDHQERRVPLNDKLYRILINHKPGRIWMFETPQGSPRKNNLNRELKRAGKYAGINIRGLNMRVLRETFGSHLRQRGVDIALISQYMGHSSTDVTLRHYAHIQIGETHDEINQL